MTWNDVGVFPISLPFKKILAPDGSDVNEMSSLVLSKIVAQAVSDMQRVIKAICFLIISSHAHPPSAMPAYSVHSWLSPSLGRPGTSPSTPDII